MSVDSRRHQRSSVSDVDRRGHGAPRYEGPCLREGYGAGEGRRTTTTDVFCRVDGRVSFLGSGGPVVRFGGPRTSTCLYEGLKGLSLPGNSSRRHVSSPSPRGTLGRTKWRVQEGTRRGRDRVGGGRSWGTVLCEGGGGTTDTLSTRPYTPSAP